MVADAAPGLKGLRSEQGVGLGMPLPRPTEVLHNVGASVMKAAQPVNPQEPRAVLFGARLMLAALETMGGLTLLQQSCRPGWFSVNVEVCLGPLLPQCAWRCVSSCFGIT